MAYSSKIRKILRDLAQFLRQSGVALSASEINIKKCYNKHKGETCFIIGSGPSLAMSDLDLIRGRCSIGVNKIYLAYNHTKWRPSYYVVADKRIAEEIKADAHKIECQKFVEKWAFRPLGNQEKWCVLPEYIVNGERTKNFSKDLLSGTGGGATVIYTALQIAYYMGFQRVVLLGVDFDYGSLKPTGEVSSTGETLVTTNGASYFDQNYSQPGRVLSAPRYEEQRKAFRLAQIAFTEENRVLINASRRTKLDVIPHGRLEDYID